MSRWMHSRRLGERVSEDLLCSWNLTLRGSAASSFAVPCFPPSPKHESDATHSVISHGGMPLKKPSSRALQRGHLVCSASSSMVLAIFDVAPLCATTLNTGALDQFEGPDLHHPIETASNALQPLVARCWGFHWGFETVVVATQPTPRPAKIETTVADPEPTWPLAAVVYLTAPCAKESTTPGAREGAAGWQQDSKAPHTQKGGQKPRLDGGHQERAKGLAEFIRDLPECRPSHPDARIGLDLFADACVGPHL